MWFEDFDFCELILVRVVFQIQKLYQGVLVNYFFQYLLIYFDDRYGNEYQKIGYYLEVWVKGD